MSVCKYRAFIFLDQPPPWVSRTKTTVWTIGVKSGQQRVHQQLLGIALKGISQGLQDTSNSRQETVIKVYETQQCWSWTSDGREKSATTATCFFRGLIPAASTRWPRKSTAGAGKTNLAGFIWSPLSHTLVHVLQVFFLDRLVIKWSSTYDNTKGRHWKMWYISHWKDWAAFLKLNNMNRYSKSSKGVRMTVLVMFSVAMGIDDTLWWV
jgi:hypothetical protein